MLPKQGATIRVTFAFMPINTTIILLVYCDEKLGRRQCTQRYSEPLHQWCLVESWLA